MTDMPNPIVQPESDPKSQAVVPPDTGTLPVPDPKPKADGGLKAILENNIFMVIAATVFAASAAIYGILNGWYGREYALKKAQLEDHYNMLSTQLDSERAQIKLTIGTESKLISSDRVFVDPTSLDKTYSVQGGTFAVPALLDNSGKWTWKTRSELELVGEALGPAQVKELISDQARKMLEANARTAKVLCYEAPSVREIKVAEHSMRVRPRAYFQKVTWDEISKIQTAANANNVQGLFDAIDNIGNGIDLLDFEELFILDPDFPRDKKLKMLVEKSLADELARAAIKQQGRVSLFLAYLKEHFPSDVYQKVVGAFETKKHELDIAEKKKKQDAEQRKNNAVKIEPDRLATFLSMFVQVGSGNESDFKASDYSFKDNAFSVQGYYNVSAPTDKTASTVTRIYILKVGFMRNDGIYVMGFVYPADSDFSGLHQMMSLVERVRILK